MTDKITAEEFKKIVSGRIRARDYRVLNDKNNNLISDHYEQVKKAKPLTLEMIEGDKPSKFWKAVKATLAGETTVGVIFAEIKNVAKHFVPYGHLIDGVTDTAGSLFSTKKEKPMLKKILSIKNFINMRDENGKFAPMELVYSVIQIAIVAGIVWGLVELGIYSEVIDFLDRLNGPEETTGILMLWV